MGQSPKCGTSENCASPATSPQRMNIKCTKSGTSYGTFNLKRTSITDITPMCGSQRSRCAQPCNGTFPYGIEKHTFKGTLDLRKAMKAGCCEIEISVRLFVRNVGITTGQSQQGFYTFANINPCQSPCNNSPTLTNDPVAILCCNQPYTFNNGAVDPDGIDSISYSLAAAYQNAGRKCTYTGGRSETNPISTYYPSGLKFPFSNPKTNPPIGLFLDKQTGDFIFTPTKCNQVAVVVMQMDEWRQDSTGKYIKIATTRRDMQFIVMTCPGNNPPIVNGPFSYSVCEGEQICFTVTTDDKPKSTPGKPPPPKDTVTISWNRGIPGATFTVVNKKALHQSGRFCWTPKIGSARSLPYTFTVSGRDNACPLNAVSVRAFSIKVKPRAVAERPITTLKCGRYAVQSKTAAGFKGTPTYQWLLLDSNGLTLFDRKKAFLESTNSFISSNEYDTIQFRSGGKYIVKHTINNPPNNCPTIYYDTLVIPPMLEADLAFGPDTFVCANTDLTIQPKILNGVAPIKYLWSTGDTTQSITIQLPTVVTDSVFGVSIEDASGCVAWDSTRVYQKPIPWVEIGPDRRICTYDDILLLPQDSLAVWIDPNDTSQTPQRQGDTLFTSFYHNGTLISTDSQFRANVAGEYVVTVTDSLGCIAYDTMTLHVNDTVTASAGPDQTICFNDSLKLVAGGLDTAGNGKTGIYRWYEISPPIDITLGTDSVLHFVSQKSADYRLTLSVTEDTTSCFDADTVSIKVDPLPVLNIAADMDLCCDAGAINLNNNTNPKGGIWYSTKNPNYVKSQYEFQSDLACDPNAKTEHFVTYEYTDPTTSCVNRDSVSITLNPLPRLQLADGYFCQDKGTVDLGEITVLPARLTGPSRTVNCLDCGSYNEADIIKFTGPSFNKMFYFDISPSAMPLGSKDNDSITIEFIYGDANGCFVRDTATIIVTKVPEIKFLAIPDMCWDEGKVDLKDRTSVTPTDGFWFCYDTTLAVPNFRYCADSFMNGALTTNIFGGDTINTMATNPLGGTYYMRYMHTRSGCPTFRDTFMTINPLPKPVIDVTVLDDGIAGYTPPPYLFCEDRTDISMIATPGGGVWSSPHGGAVTGNTFKPASSPTKTPFYIGYLYTDANGCVGRDSVQVEIEAKPTLDLSLYDTSLCRHPGMNIDVSATYNNTTGVTWFPITGGTVDDPTADDINFSFNTSNDTTQNHVVAVQTKAGAACPFTSKTLIVRVNPIPDATITPDDPDGCQPHLANFTTAFLNKVNPGTSTYAWDFGDGGTDASQNPSYLFNTVGVNDVSLTITTEHLCDTTLTFPITVHPIPVANFTPNPNNSTTAALPKFVFNNESTIASGVILSNLWDFGEAGKTSDTSTELSPTYFYPSDTGSYWVTLTVVSEFGCRDSITKPVIIGPDILVFIPNAFSPDGGGPNQNDGFRAEVNDAVRDYHLIVFDRWGEILWESKDPNERWDGTYKGLPAQQDVYAYHLNVTSWKGETYRFHGTLTLLR